MMSLLNLLTLLLSPSLGLYWNDAPIWNSPVQTEGPILGYLQSTQRYYLICGLGNNKIYYRTHTSQQWIYLMTVSEDYWVQNDAYVITNNKFYIFYPFIGESEDYPSNYFEGLITFDGTKIEKYSLTQTNLHKLCGVCASYNNGNNIYLFGGTTDGSKNYLSAIIQVFNINTMKATRLSTALVRLSGYLGCQYYSNDNAFYVYAGMGSDKYIYKYSVNSNSVTYITSFTIRGYFRSVIVPDKYNDNSKQTIYVLGGNMMNSPYWRHIDVIELSPNNAETHRLDNSEDLPYIRKNIGTYFDSNILGSIILIGGYQQHDEVRKDAIISNKLLTIPTHNPTKTPTKQPTKNPTKYPTKKPTKNPSKMPTISPTKKPTLYPTVTTNTPTKYPTQITDIPSVSPSKNPTQITSNPTFEPTQNPTIEIRNVMNSKYKIMFIATITLSGVLLILCIGFIYFRCRNKNYRRISEPGRRRNSNIANEHQSLTDYSNQREGFPYN